MKINRNLLKFAVLCTAMSDAGIGATTPALGSIAAAMPLVAPGLIQMISSISALFLAITPPFYAKMVSLGIRKRTLLYWAAALFLLGGIGPYFFHSNIWIILFFRAILGIGTGISIPLSTDLVVDFFEGKERHSMMGYVSATTGISGILFQMVGGYLAGINWTYCFLAYGSTVLFLIAAFAFLPEPDRQAKIAVQEGTAEVQTKISGSIYLIALLFGIFFVLWYILPNNGAMVMIMEGIAVPAQIGVAFSFVTVGSFLMSVTFGQLFKAFKFSLLPISFVLGAAGLYTCYASHTLPMFTVGITLTGFGMGIVVPATMTKLTGLVPYSAASRVISIGFFAMGFGGFLQPIIFNFFGPTGVGRTAFFYGAIGMAVFAVVMYAVEKATAVQKVAIETSEI
ncbi:MAG: MFS transporter [Eubacteriaceae bacterium]|nr:MFS transporter [Eubacteriaceae bacterium]